MPLGCHRQPKAPAGAGIGKPEAPEDGPRLWQVFDLTEDMESADVIDAFAQSG